MKKFYTVFIVCCLLVCLIPFAAMTVRPTTQSTENRMLSAFPSPVNREGGLNLNFFREFETYFSEHFAFRNELVYADSFIQSGVFHSSASERVIVGSEDWLYYASTLPDYLGSDRMSARELYNTAHNLALTDAFVRRAGSEMLIAVPPNKNTLYGEHMPYYASLIVDPVHSMDALTPLLREQGLRYADLAALFRAEGETLYLKRDSHWNNRGALLAYDLMMDTLGLAHEDYRDAPATRSFDQQGDLSRMLYTLYGDPGPDYHYSSLQPYERLDGGTAPDDPWIETSGAEGHGSLLMFRDSFGNTLLPFFAGAFEQARFTREAPYGLESLMAVHRPDVVILEKVERNLRDFIREPPIFSALEANEARDAAESPAACSIRREISPNDPGYTMLRGEVAAEALRERTDILVELNGCVYEAFHIGENGFLLYLRRELTADPSTPVRVLTRDGGELLCVWSGQLGEEGGA